MANLQGFLLALAVTLVLVPFVRKRAIAAGYYDAPGERKIHKYPIPRLGGIAIFVGFMVALAIAAMVKTPYIAHSIAGILAGGTIMFILGLLDDLYQLSPYLKLLVQFIAALAAFSLGVEINTLDLPGSKLIILNALSLPLTVLWIVGFSNAMNFIDGVDGLAAGVTTISAITLMVVAMFTGQPASAMLAALLAGASLGFLAYNFNPAKIFMGDSGALFCGFILAAIAVTGVLKTKVVVMLLPMFVLSVPILDITYSVVRRVLQGKNPFLPDANHIHHQLMKSGATQVRTVMYLYSLCVVGGLIATGYIGEDRYINYLATYISLIALLVLLATFLIKMVRRFYTPSPTEIPVSAEDAQVAQAARDAVEKSDPP